jgi:hypothetical protein
MENYLVDLHSHTSDFSHFIFEEIDKKKYAQNLIEKLSKSGSRVVLGVSNFNDDGRYENLVSAFKLLRPKKYIIDFTHEDYFIKIRFGNKKIWFIKTDEIGTEKGHILIVGYRGKIGTRRISKVLTKAHREGCVIIANHPLHGPSFLYALMSKIIGENTAFSFNEKELIEKIPDLDAIELNSYFPEDWKKIRRFAKKHSLRVISGSDAHFFSELFTSHFILKRLDFSNVESYKSSFHREFKQKIRVYAKKHSFFAEYKHGIQVLFFENLLRQIGIVKGSKRP